MEIWAYCDECSRWFHCPDWFDRAKPQPLCPECRREPKAIENRAATADSARSAHMARLPAAASTSRALMPYARARSAP